MSSYRIFADSACDLKPETLDSFGVEYLSLTFRFEGDGKEYENGDMPVSEFYERMRKGGVARTAAVNSEAFVGAFKKILDGGDDILYLGFSSGLSTTFNSARIAAEELKGSYPERKIIVIDTLSASAGIGLIIKFVVDKKNSGASIEEAAAFAEELKYKLCHWFTVDDLVYLKRGGRISPTVAFVGNMLGIKPVLHMDDDGHLINMFKVRGRKTSIAALADKYGELAVQKDGVAYISNADCQADAEELKRMLTEKYGAKVEIITDVGTVIGAHSGPGTLALFFVGTTR